MDPNHWDPLMGTPASDQTALYYSLVKGGIMQCARNLQYLRNNHNLKPKLRTMTVFQRV
jgi:hypothetical protein